MSISSNGSVTVAMSKHDHLRACKTRRQLILRQLFQTTLTRLQQSNLTSSGDDLASFFEANDISK